MVAPRKSVKSKGIRERRASKPGADDNLSVEITPEMIEAGARVLMGDSTLNLGPMSAEILAEKVISNTLAARFGETS
jgi:hypothetical protein